MNGKSTVLDVPGATATTVTAINSLGQVVGYYTASGQQHDFIYTNGVFTTNDPPGVGGTPYAINAHDQVVGEYYSNNSDHGFTATPQHGEISHVLGVAATEAAYHLPF